MVGGTDGLPFPTQAQVNPSLCVSCGICVGVLSVVDAVPAQRGTQDRHRSAGLFSQDLRERTVEAGAALSGPSRILVLACDYGGGRRLDGTVHMPCVAMAPPSLIDFVLSRDLADGVVVAGCSKSACFNRLGGDWTEQRFAGTRDPYLRARVPRERIATVWTSALESGA